LVKEELYEDETVLTPQLEQALTGPEESALKQKGTSFIIEEREETTSPPSPLSQIQNPFQEPPKPTPDVF